MPVYNGQEIPDQDYGGIAEDWVIDLLNYLGYEWPKTNTNVLDAWADSWRDAQHRIDSLAAELEAANAHVVSNNEGPVTEAFVAFNSSPDGPATAIKTVSGAAPLVAGGYSAVSLLINGLRAAVIAEILMDAISIGMAIFTGGLSAAASVLGKQAAGAAIDFLIDQAINEILGG